MFGQPTLPASDGALDAEHFRILERSVYSAESVRTTRRRLGGLCNMRN